MKSLLDNKMVLRLLLLLGLLTAFVSAQNNSLVLDVSGAKYKINRTIYGGLLEDWGRDMYGGIYVGTSSTVPNTNGMRNDVIAGLKEVGVGVLQFPGGCKAEVYDWRDGVGPKASRPGGDKVNGMGTDEYFQLCGLLDCAPFLQANCREGTPAQMVAWLKYVDSLYPNKLRYLGMGNEPWGGCYAGISVQEYLSKWYEPFNNAIPQSFKGKLVRVASYYTTMAETDTVLRRELGNMEGLSYHYYTTMGWAEGQKTNSFNFSETDYYNVLQKAYDIEGGINDVISRMGKYDPNFTYGLQPDEWGAWYNEIAGMGKSYQQSSIRDALIAGQHLNLFNNNCRRIWMAQVAQPCNAIQSMFLTNQTTGAMIKTPTFYTYKLYKPHHNATMIPRTLNCGTVSSKNLKTLTASASIDSTKTIHISITNIHATQAQSLAVTLNGYTFSKVSGEVISGQSFNSINDYGVAENVNIKELPQSAIQTTGSSALTVSIPEHSVVMLTLTPPGTGVTVQAATMENMTVGVSAASGNRILIHHGFTEPTPVVISLFSVDGKLMAPVCKTIARPEVKSLVWVPSMRKNSMRTAVVSITAGGKRGWTEQVIVGR